MPTLNLGILAHVDAGKTTLTERFLHSSGATRYLGRVDHGTTVTDADQIERRRGITIRTAVATMQVPSSTGVVTVNLIDTPGHPDFIAEVERALGVLDGAVLVVSAVEGVQAQTRVLARILERMAMPFLVFLNKVDRGGASIDNAMAALQQLLSNAPVAMTHPLQVDEVVDAVSPWDEQLLHEYVDGSEPPTQERLFAAVAEQARRGNVHPVFAGSALHGVGVSDFLAALPNYLPVVHDWGEATPHATVFRVDRDAAGQRLAYVRMHHGHLAPRDQVTVHRRGSIGTVTVRRTRALDVRPFTRGAETHSDVARAGDVAIIAGLGAIAVGDQLGSWDPVHAGRHFGNPGLESVVEARDPAQRIRLFEALQQLGEQDPLIDVRLDGPDRDVTVTLYGEVQKQVLAARLAEEHGVVADFLPTRVVHVERVTGTGEAEAVSTLGNVRVGLLVGATAVGTGLDYRLGSTVEKGWLLPQYHHAIEDQLTKELDHGLHGWRITDLKVRTIASRWAAPVPAPSDFREITHVAFRKALAAAGTVVCAPVSRFELETPATDLSAVLGLVADLGGTPESVQSEASARIGGTLPTALVAVLEQRLPNYTGGSGVLWTEPAGHVPVNGKPPSR